MSRRRERLVTNLQCLLMKARASEVLAQASRLFFSDRFLREWTRGREEKETRRARAGGLAQALSYAKQAY